MPKLNCSVIKCNYQDKNHCCRNSIDVEGIAAHRKAETACLSYLPKTGEAYAEEFAKEFGPDKPEKIIYCDAVNCVYERNSKCHADRIEIDDSKNATSSGYYKSTETMCKTFERRD